MWCRIAWLRHFRGTCCLHHHGSFFSFGYFYYLYMSVLCLFTRSLLVTVMLYSSILKYSLSPFPLFPHFLSLFFNYFSLLFLLIFNVFFISFPLIFFIFLIPSSPFPSFYTFTSPPPPPPKRLILHQLGESLPSSPAVQPFGKLQPHPILLLITKPLHRLIKNFSIHNTHKKALTPLAVEVSIAKPRSSFFFLFILIGQVFQINGMHWLQSNQAAAIMATFRFPVSMFMQSSPSSSPTDYFNSQTPFHCRAVRPPNSDTKPFFV